MTASQDSVPRWVQPPAVIPFLLRPALWLARRMTGKDPLPARLLSHFQKGALAIGIFEAAAPHGPKDLESRVLSVARIVASAVGGCPFCLDMNAANWKSAGLNSDELQSLVHLQRAQWAALGPRESLAARYADGLSQTPVVLDEALKTSLKQAFSDRELVILCMTIAQVNFWTRFNQGLDVPSAGFFDESVCRLPTR